MPRSRPPYPPEFREQIIELVRAGRTQEELAEKYEPSAQTIRNWVTPTLLSPRRLIHLYVEEGTPRKGITSRRTTAAPRRYSSPSSTRAPAGSGRAERSPESLDRKDWEVFVSERRAGGRDRGAGSMKLCGDDRLAAACPGRRAATGAREWESDVGRARAERSDASVARSREGSALRTRCRGPTADPPTPPPAVPGAPLGMTTGGTEKPRHRLSSIRASVYQIWAWVDSNHRPHAYQPDRCGFRGFPAAGRIAEYLDGTRNLHVEGGGGGWGAGGN